MVWPDARLDGLSPRMRGNPPSLSPAFPTIRSIPAYAGEPPSASHRKSRAPRSIPAYAGEPRQARRILYRPRVYPRVCGGTHDDLSRRQSRQGLSPRMRGNQRQLVWVYTQARSIPAYAGEP